MSRDRPFSIRRVAILGAGNGGQTFAAHLGLLPGVESLTLYNRSPERLAAIAGRGNRIRVRGEVGGEAGTESRVDRLTDDPAAAVRGADLVILATTQQALAPLGRAIAQAVAPHQVLIIGSGTLGATWELRAALRSGGCRALPTVGEFSILPYATKLDGGRNGQVWVRSVKGTVSVAFAPPQAAPTALVPWLRRLYPGLTVGEDVLYTGLDGVNMVVHPAVIWSNIHRVRRGRPWRLYADGVTPEVATLMEEIDGERLAVAAACGLRIQSLFEFVLVAYPPFDGLRPTTLYTWFRSRMRSRRGQVHLEAVPGPLSMEHRLIREDVAYGLVPLEAVGQVVGVPTPTVSRLIDRANRELGDDLRAAGRSLPAIEVELRAALARRGVQLGP